MGWKIVKKSSVLTALYSHYAQVWVEGNGVFFIIIIIIIYFLGGGEYAGPYSPLVLPQANPD